MLRSLLINKKQYLSQEVLAVEHDCSVQFLSLLARDDKILATRIGGEWFIEPESLRVYLLQLAIEERFSLEDEALLLVPEAAAVVDTPPTVTFLKSFVVVCCGLMLAFLTWQLPTDGSRVASVIEGSQVVMSDIKAALLPDVSLFGFQFAATPVVSPAVVGTTATPSGSPAPADTQGVYTTFPKISHSDMPQQIFPFADAVEVRQEGDSMLVRPVLPETVSQWHEFESAVVVPNP